MGKIFAAIHLESHFKFVMPQTQTIEKMFVLTEETTVEELAEFIYQTDDDYCCIHKAMVHAEHILEVFKCHPEANLLSAGGNRDSIEGWMRSHPNYTITAEYPSALKAFDEGMRKARKHYE